MSSSKEYSSPAACAWKKNAVESYTIEISGSVLEARQRKIGGAIYVVVILPLETVGYFMKPPEILIGICILIALIGAGYCSLACTQCAESNGRKPFQYGWIGFICPPLGLLAFFEKPARGLER